MRPVQLLKAELPIEIAPCGMSKEDKPLQLENALLPIVLTFSGIVMDNSLEQPLKALFAIPVSPEKYCNSLNDVIDGLL